MGWIPIILFAVAGWVSLLAAIQFWIAPRLASRFANDPVYGFLSFVAASYCRLVHRPRYSGLELVPHRLDAGPLIVVCNHASGLDPVLLQIACRFEIRWMMSEEMMVPQLDWLWKRLEPIAVNFDAADSAAVREAIRHVKAGGVLGIFPEGGIERPPRMLQPFANGAGLIIARCKAPVLLAFISDTPVTEGAFAALTTPSSCRVQFLDLIDYSGTRDSRAITDDLQQRLARASGWPICESPDPSNL